MTKCQWFEGCNNKATTTRTAPNTEYFKDLARPATAQVPICSHCNDKLNQIKNLNQENTNA